MKIPYRSSPSQVSEFELCNRKWALNKIAKIPQPQNAKASWGTAMHKHLENFFRDGTDIPHDPQGLAAAQCLTVAPLRGGNVAAELKIEGTLAGCNYLGYVDLVDYDEDEIFDWKSCGNFRYVPRDLSQHVAATWYAWHFMRNFFKTRVRVTYIYATRDGRSVKPVYADLTHAKIHKRLEKTKKSLNVMRGHYEAQTDPMTIPGDDEGCTAFDGCPYLPLCKPKDKTMALTAAEFKAQMIAKNAGTTVEVNPPEKKKKRKAPKPSVKAKEAKPVERKTGGRKNVKTVDVEYPLEAKAGVGNMLDLSDRTGALMSALDSITVAEYATLPGDAGPAAAKLYFALTVGSK